MISKELFCKTIANIKTQDKMNREFSYALSKMCGGGHPPLFGTDDLYFLSLLELLEEILNDKDGYIEWFLYEGIDDKKVYSEEKTWDVNTPEGLYDFLLEEYVNE